MLTFNLKKEWFEKIKSGKKTHEYREVKDYWTDRMVKEFYHIDKSKMPFYFEKIKQEMLEYFRKSSTPYETRLCFMNGMVSEEKKLRLYAKMKSIRIIDGKESDLKIDAPVFDIEFELIKEE